jgi:hypothetical protein
MTISVPTGPPWQARRKRRHIGGSVRVAAARPDYAARRGPSRKSVAAGCGLHRYIPN